MKNHTRFSKASGSTRRRVDELINRGWFPGARHWDLKPSRRGRRLDRQTS